MRIPARRSSGATGGGPGAGLAGPDRARSLHHPRPFPGRILNLFVCAGQFVLKGSPILELADTTSLRVVLPVDRRGVSVGSTLTVAVEEQEVPCKVQALLPLPESFFVLRELATPFAAASVVVPNPKGELEPGLRARPSGVPTTAIAAVPRRAIRPDEIRGAAGSMVQVIRNEYVTNVPVHVLGSLGNDRIQISGLLRETDALIIGSSVPLMPGTLVRFADNPGVRGVEGTSPDPSRSGIEAGITHPAAGCRQPRVALGRERGGRVPLPILLIHPPSPSLEVGTRLRFDPPFVSGE